MSEQPIFNSSYTSEQQINSGLNHDVVKAGGSLVSISSDEQAAASGNVSQFLKAGENAYRRYEVSHYHQDLLESVKQFGHAIELDNYCYNAKIQLTLALVAHQTLKPEQAIEQLEKLSQIDLQKDERTKCLWTLGILYKQLGQYRKAINAFCELLKLAPLAMPKARFALTQLFLIQAKQHNTNTYRSLSLTAQAFGQFTIAMMTLPFDLRSAFQLGFAAKSDIEVKAVIGGFNLLKQVNLTEASTRLLQWSTAVRPNEAIFYQLLADECLDSEQPDAAIYYYTRATEIHPGNTDTQKNLAKAYVQCDDRTSALQCLEKLVETTTADGEIYYDLAHLYVAEQNYMRALYYFKEASGHYPENPYIHSNMAYVLFKLEDYTGAIEEYRLAIDHGSDPRWTATVAQTLATIYYQLLEDKDQALEYFMLANELVPDNVECMVMLADLYFEENQLQDALDLYERIKEIDPENPECHNYIGYLLWQMDRNDDAIEAYQEALTITPDNATALNNLGVIYLDEEFNPNKALTLFEQALEAKPEYTLAAFNLGRTKEWIGDRTGAAKAYAAAQELNNDNAEMDAEEIQDRINQLFEA